MPWRLRGLKYISSGSATGLRLGVATLLGREVAPSDLLDAFGRRFLSESLASAEQAGMRPFLAFGTLLGHRRDGGFIRHDADIDLGLLEVDQPREKVDALEREMHARGFLTRHREPHEISFYKYHFPTLLVDFFYFFREGDTFVYYDRRGDEYYRYVFPVSTLSNLAPATFVGLAALVPADLEGFLDASYGDWQTPRTAFDNVGGHPNRQLVERPARFADSDELRELPVGGPGR